MAWKWTGISLSIKEIYTNEFDVDTGVDVARKLSNTFAWTFLIISISCVLTTGSVSSLNLFSSSSSKRRGSSSRECASYLASSVDSGDVLCSLSRTASKSGIHLLLACYNGFNTRIYELVVGTG